MLSFAKQVPKFVLYLIAYQVFSCNLWVLISLIEAFWHRRDWSTFSILTQIKRVQFQWRSNLDPLVWSACTQSNNYGIGAPVATWTANVLTTIFSDDIKGKKLTWLDLSWYQVCYYFVFLCSHWTIDPCCGAVAGTGTCGTRFLKDSMIFELLASW